MGIACSLAHLRNRGRRQSLPYLQPGIALLVGLATMLSVPSAGLALGGNANAKLPDVLDRYRQNMERITSKYAMDSEYATTQEYKGASQRYVFLYHCRRDNDLIDVRIEQFPADKDGNRSANPAFLRTALITRKNEVFFYDGPHGKDPYVIYSALGAKQRAMAQAQLSSGCGALDGFLAGDQVSIWKLLQEQGEVTVRPAREDVGGSLCYVVEAAAKDHGRYSLWLDPDHGYLPRKVVVEKSAEDDYGGSHLTQLPQLRDLTKIEWSMTDIQIESVNGVLVPVSCRIAETWQGRDGVIQKTSGEYKRTKIDLNPDFEAIGAFKPDLPEGIKVNSQDAVGIGVAFQWKGGAVVPAINEKEIGIIDKVADELKADYTAGSAPTEDSSAVRQSPLESQAETERSDSSGRISGGWLFSVVAIAGIVAAGLWVIYRRRKQ
jgi:hypothetical protein